MKIQAFAAAALMTVGLLGAANAADLPMPAPAYSAPPVPVYNWTGCYVGGGGGYAFWQQDSFVVSPAGVPVTASQSNGGTGWFGQGQVGCDYQFQLRLPLLTFFLRRSLSAPSAISKAAASMAAQAFHQG
jgi:outer membrane immunogenic protein